MKKNRPFPFVKVTKKQEKSIRGGHPWIFADEIVSASDEIDNGAVTDVFGSKDQYLGSGLYSRQSLIRIRLLSSDANETFSDAFFQRRADYALSYRRTVMGDDFHACRLIHGEADGLPGLTADLYEDVLVTEVLSYGMDMRKDVIYRALKERLLEEGIRLRGIYERNEGELRKKEGLSQYKGWYGEDGGETRVLIRENGIEYLVDFENGQKTGFFLDQKYNRRAAAAVARGKRVLDCCTHVGTFALNAAAGGAGHVTAVDISAAALESAEANAERNHLSGKVDFVCSDVFEYLETARREHQKFDLVILDPPAFTKSRKTMNSAYAGYRRLNYLGMRLLERGGYLVTCSCSHFMSNADFRNMLHEAASDAGVSLRVVEVRQAAPDHPSVIGIPETEYLKFYVLQII